MQDIKRYINKFIEISVLTMTILIPVIFYTHTNDVFEINKMFIFRFFTILICAMWAYTAVVLDKKISFVRSDFEVPMVWYFVTCVLSTVFTINFLVSIYGVYEDYEGILTIINYIMLYFIIINFINKAEMIKKVFVAMLIASGIISIYGIAQNYGWDFVMWNPDTYSPDRFFATLGNPNFLAAYLVCTIPPMFILFFSTQEKLKKMIILVVLFSSIIVVFFTKSRGGLLSFITTIVLIGLYTIVDARKKENELFTKNKIWFILAGILILLSFFHPKVKDAFGMIWGRTKSLFTIEGWALTPRMYIWKSALMMYRDHLPFGTGLDTFQVMFPYYRLPIYWQLEWNGTPEKTHNIFLQVLATQGAIGFGAFMLIMVAFLKKSYNLIFGEKDIHKRYLAFGVMMAMIAFIVQGLFNYTVVSYGFIFWGGLGMLIVLDSTQKKIYARNFSAEISSFIDNNRWIIVTIIAAVFMTMEIFLTRYWTADIYYKIGNIGVSSDKDVMALPYYERAVALASNREIYWVKYGIDYEKVMREETDPNRKSMAIDEAIKIHEHTIAINPYNGYNYNNLARVYKFYGEIGNVAKYEDAIKYYNEAINRDPNNAYFGMDLASIYINKREFDKAFEICKHYAEMYPTLATPFSYMGYIYMLQGPAKLDQARQYYEQAVDNKQWFKDVVSESSTYSNLGIIYVNMKMYDKAIDAFLNAVRVNPGYKEGFLNLGILYAKIGNIDKAISSYNAALQLDPNDPRPKQALEQLQKKAPK